MISPSASPADCLYLAITAPSVIRLRLGVPPGCTTNLSPDSCQGRLITTWGSASLWRKDPGSAFGPKTVPLATGSVAVVYWVPGPFHGIART